MLRPTLTAALALILGLLQPATHAAGRAVTFRAGDGRTLTGTLTEASLRPAPAVVLVPMLSTSKDAWEVVAQRLAEANITGLAIDLPGTSLPAQPEALAAWQSDIRAALDYLAGRPDVRPGSLGVLGASLGANLAVLAAVADPRVRSLVLVSPSLDYRGVRIEAAMRQYGARPALFVASLKDPYAARSVRDLSKDISGPRETRWAETTAHGTTLLAREPDLVRVLAEWFLRTLG